MGYDKSEASVPSLQIIGTVIDVASLYMEPLTRELERQSTIFYSLTPTLREIRSSSQSVPPNQRRVLVEGAPDPTPGEGGRQSTIRRPKLREITVAHNHFLSGGQFQKNHQNNFSKSIRHRLPESRCLLKSLIEVEESENSWGANRAVKVDEDVLAE